MKFRRIFFHPASYFLMRLNDMRNYHRWVFMALGIFTLSMSGCAEAPPPPTPAAQKTPRGMQIPQQDGSAGKTDAAPPAGS